MLKAKNPEVRAPVDVEEPSKGFMPQTGRLAHQNGGLRPLARTGKDLANITTTTTSTSRTVLKYSHGYVSYSMYPILWTKLSILTYLFGRPIFNLFSKLSLRQHKCFRASGSDQVLVQRSGLKTRRNRPHHATGLLHLLGCAGLPLIRGRGSKCPGTLVRMLGLPCHKGTPGHSHW